jgi:polyphosphate kinase 2
MASVAKKEASAAKSAASVAKSAASVGKSAVSVAKKDASTAKSAASAARKAAAGDGAAAGLSTKVYEKELRRLQVELVKLQEWVRASGARVAVIFEGRDGAGKGGTISRITQYLNPRVVRVAALPAPSDRERSQWYFQRYVGQLPSAGEMVLFDRSWYNRAGVEYVMGFCTPAEHRLFLQQCPIFERLLISSGIILIKYWFSVSDQEQERRFQLRLSDPLKQWKLSQMDLESRSRWVEYSRAKDIMFAHTDTRESPWFVVEADDKQRARVNCLSHLLSQVPYKDVLQTPIKLPPRQSDDGYIRPSRDTYTYVPDHSAELAGPASEL